MPKKANNYITISYKVHLISVSEIEVWGWFALESAMKLFRTIPVKFSVEQNHLPRLPLLEWPVGPASVEGDFV